VLLAVTLASLAGVACAREPIVALFRAAAIPSMLGPLDPAAGYRAILQSLAQAAIVFGLGLALTWLARSRPRFAGCAAVIALAADLAAANARHVVTVPQAVFHAESQVAQIIRQAERAKPSSGPFRIHRMPIWYPFGWGATPAKDRIAEVVSWERDTIQPKHGINLGVEYTHTVGAAQLDHYDWYFARFPSAVNDAQTARSLGIEVGREVIYYPRRAYDLWNTRYFVVPFDANGWRDPTRGYASLLFQSEQIYPDPARFAGPGGREKAREWIDARDFKVMRNLAEYPRAWVVHRARATVPPSGLSRGLESAAMHEILYAGDPMWYDARRPVYDPRSLAWVDTETFARIERYLSGKPAYHAETVKVAYPDPQRAVLEVSLDSPGLVILADLYYPGWELAVDGAPAPVYRVNGAMRGAAVPAGSHRLVYSYNPLSFRIGRGVSIAGLVVLFFAAVGCTARPADPVLSGGPWWVSDERHRRAERGPYPAQSL
jgi:hypothetical protein